jgi:hypothetical protein
MLMLISWETEAALHISTRQDLGSWNIYPAVGRHIASVLQISQ